MSAESRASSDSQDPRRLPVMYERVRHGVGVDVECDSEDLMPPSDGEDSDGEQGQRQDELEDSGDKDAVSPHSALKRRRSGSHAPEERPFKRKNGLINHEYLDLLNSDIEDAAERHVPDLDGLPPSQIGLSYWTGVEKDLFFGAISRLGRDDIRAIASKTRTKSEMEVVQYLTCIQNALRTRKEQRELYPVQAIDFPAATELSQACCNALEDAADALSFRQESHEEEMEQRKWGSCWLIEEGSHKAVSVEDYPALTAIDFFRVGTWLRLSSSYFMNASVAEYNWQSVSTEPPAIRATALQDFHSLVVSLTRRLVVATIQTSEARIRAERAAHPETRDMVWPDDVRAAALSLGLKPDSRNFWGRCARRLRLDVYDTDTHGMDEPQALSYAAVERELLVPQEPQASACPKAEDGKDEELTSLSNTPDVDRESATPDDTVRETDADSVHQSERVAASSDEETDEEVRREANEIFTFSALDYRNSYSSRQKLKAAIKAARAHEAHADAMDERATYKEEKRLWAMLQLEPPEPLVRVEQPKEPTRKRRTVDDLYPTGADWRDTLDYTGEWELRYLERKDEPDLGSVGKRGRSSSGIDGH